MNDTAVRAFRRAMNSSVLVRGVRRVAAGSAVCAAVGAAMRWPTATQWLRRTRERIVVGLGGEWSDEEQLGTAKRLDTVVADSRILNALSSIVMAPTSAWREAAVWRVLDPILSVDLPTRFHLGGSVVVVATLTHTVVLALLGVPVHALGWSFRVGLFAVGLLFVWRPEALAAAWRDKAGPPTPHA